MGTPGLTSARTVRRLLQARHRADWVPAADYTITEDALFAQNPDAVAVLRDGTHLPETVTFGRIQRAAVRIAAVLRGRGIGPGDRVLLYLDPSVEAAEVVFGVLTAGAVLVPVPRLLTGASVTHRLVDSGATVVVTDGPGVDRLESTGCSLRDVDVLTVDSAGGPGLGDLIRRVDPLDPVPRRADDPALLIYTSGTSGAPKGIVHGHRALLGHAGVDYAFELFRPGDIYFGTADWGWIGGLMLGLLVPWSLGVPVVAHRPRRFDPGATLDTMSRLGVTTAFLPASVLRMFAEHGKPAQARLRAVVTGGEPAGVAELGWARRNLSDAVNKAYGQTEANALIGDSGVLGSVDDDTMGAPYPGHRIALLDEQGARVARGEVGEIALELPDPVALLGYWDAASARPVPPADSWHRTGDLARIAYGRRLEYVGRADDVIKSRGYRIGPAEIEAVLGRHPRVLAAAAVGLPDPETGQRIKAFVQLTSGELTDEMRTELRELVANAVGPHARPREIEAVAELPRTETGKIRRRALVHPA
ncbi:AMP-binding protein [Nocardia sp. BMG111209]|uniref:AMP-binding protein n=1 Tax=Nocardia sp. BMG111209 TaxID=1160137 RepID=UPI00035D7DD1|nr:AMP-binding protein [Nocardia sp. BMG111209]